MHLHLQIGLQADDPSWWVGQRIRNKQTKIVCTVRGTWEDGYFEVGDGLHTYIEDIKTIGDRYERVRN